MATKFPELFASLAAPFGEGEVKTLPKGRQQLRYVTARTVANRLDEVLGPENWWDSYPFITDASAICLLTFRLPDGSTVTKCDAGGAAGMADAGDDDKSIISDAFKRAAAKWGVGRYLYRDGTPDFGEPKARSLPKEPEEEDPARREALADVRKPYGRFLADTFAAARAAFFDAAAGAGVARPIEDGDLPTIYQFNRHMLKWTVAQGRVEDPGKVSQAECGALLDQHWEASDKRGRATLRLEAIRYVRQEHAKALSGLLSDVRGEAIEEAISN